MISVLAAFDAPFLAKFLGHRFQVRTLTRFPFLDLNRSSDAAPIVFLLVEKSKLNALSGDNSESFLKQVNEIASAKRLVVVVMPDQSAPSGFWLAENSILMNELKSLRNVAILDGSVLFHFLSQDSAFQPQLQFLTGCSYSKELLKLLAEWLSKLADFSSGARPKLLITDLDNVVWGGILSEQGWSGLEASEEDPSGRAFLEMQRELLKAREQGMLLAVCSRNHASEARDAFAQLKHLPLKENHFTAFSASWQSKDLQISQICSELGILDEYVIFLDDDPHERDLVRKTHPKMQVPDLPVSAFERPLFLRRFLGISNPFLTPEDVLRAESYAKNTTRAKKDEVGLDFATWFSSLNAKILARRFSAENSQRVVQLFNKTNQFNLRPCERSEGEISTWLEREGNHLFAIEYEDTLGKDGVIALVAFESGGEFLVVRDFVLSCRAFGRGIEDSMLQWLIRKADELGKSEIQFEIVKTGRNQMGLSFLERVGFGVSESASSSARLSAKKIRTGAFLKLEEFTQ